MLKISSDILYSTFHKTKELGYKMLQYKIMQKLILYLICMYNRMKYDTLLLHKLHSNYMPTIFHKATKPPTHKKKTITIIGWDAECGNTGYRVFKRGILSWKDFCLKSTYSKEIIDLWELVWQGGVKKCQNLNLKSIFMSKIIRIFLIISI